MRFERSAGILLHPTSLPGKYGIGDLGKEAYNFLDFMESAGQRLWQIFPLGPTGYGDSPYQCFSAFAGNPLIISPDILLEEGFLNNDDLKGIPNFNPVRIDFGELIKYKHGLLKKSFEHFKNNSNGKEKPFEEFCDKNREWLEDFALFMALKEYNHGTVWSEWEKDVVLRKESTIKKWKEKLSDTVLYQKYIQFQFFHQWKNLKNYANKKEIKIIGDIPIFIAYDSSDLWSNKEIFTVDKEGNLTFIAGVPPDYFSATGQLWGNPLYKWNEMEKDDFLWWRKRISALLEMVDIIRIDHFRGFDAYWEIPAGSKTAEPGKWRKAPGEKFFNTIKKYLGKLPIIAEDLGVITKTVTELREKFDFPGMNILQFAFGTGMEARFLPHNFVHNSVVYTGSHDNDTTRAYFEKEKNNGNGIYEHAQKYLNYYGDDIVGELIRTAYASVADTIIIPMQDILKLGSEARMNFPGKLGGWWSWRFAWNQVDPKLAEHYKDLTILYERFPGIKREEVEIKIE